MKILKLIIMTLLFGLFSSCNDTNNDEIKYQHFQQKYENITKISPHDINLRFIEMCSEVDDNHPLHSYTPEMINNQCASSYRIGSEELVKLIVEILIYKKILNNDKEYSLNELKSFINRIRYGNQDKFDKIVVKAFELVIDYKTEELKLTKKGRGN